MNESEKKRQERIVQCYDKIIEQMTRKIGLLEQELGRVLEENEQLKKNEPAFD